MLYHTLTFFYRRRTHTSYTHVIHTRHTSHMMNNIHTVASLASLSGVSNDCIADLLLGHCTQTSECTAVHVMRDLGWMIQRGVENVDSRFVSRGVACAWNVKVIQADDTYTARMHDAIAPDMANDALIRAAGLK